MNKKGYALSTDNNVAFFSGLPSGEGLFFKEEVAGVEPEARRELASVWRMDAPKAPQAA